MDENLSEKLFNLISEYETAFERAFWELADATTLELFEKMGPEVCGDEIRVQLKDWFVTPNEISGGNTPLAFVGSLDEEYTIEFLNVIFENSSDVIEFYAPAFLRKQDFLFERLKLEIGNILEPTSAGDLFVDGLFFELSTLFSIYKDLRALELFISFTMNAPDEHADLVDFVQGLFENFGEDATEKLLDVAGEDKVFEGRIENIYSAISNSGKKCEQSFESLKRLFENAPIKSFAAICLAVYGDEQAVPVMMNWLETSRPEVKTGVKTEVKTEVKAEVKTEGANTELGDVLAALKQLGVDILK